MQPEPSVEEDEDYVSSEDSDFAPDAVPNNADSDSSDTESDSEVRTETNARKKKTKTGKRKHGNEKAGDSKNEKINDEDTGGLQFENSGDEEVIEETLKKQRRRRKKMDLSDAELSDEGGPGGFVRTRGMIAQALEEKKSLATTAGSTIDVDALFAKMTAASARPATYNPAQAPVPSEPSNEASGPDTDITMADSGAARSDRAPEQEDTIMIQRTYKFAGKVQTESKLVARDSAEARLFLESQSTSLPADPSSAVPIVPRRAPKKARRSIFEPVTETQPQRPDLHFGVRAGVLAESANDMKAKKLNTVEKSKMDWAGFVDKEGIKDELETAGKAKKSYLGQKEFLARVEGHQEEESRRARLKL